MHIFYSNCSKISFESLLNLNYYIFSKFMKFHNRFFLNSMLYFMRNKGVFMSYPNLLERFLTYVKVNTRSDEHSTTTPSTQSQVDFATNVLIPEMKRDVYKRQR